MPVYDVTDLRKLVGKIKTQPKTADRAAALAINKTVTYSVREAIGDITTETTLETGYVKRHIKQVSRAAPGNLRAVVVANTRETLLSRFQYHKTDDGIAVRVNKRGGFQNIPHARVMKKPLRGSFKTGIVLANKHAVGHFRRGLHKGQGRTPGKSRKLQRILRKARTKPYGVEVLHSRSINQLFVSARERIQPNVKHKLRKEFKKDFRRLSR
ncbi:hypothetical protein L1285_16830 [Pseudoalteromonas sp. DL2-H2.2]|uniref:hypothetical protein n=1 Tax=Pseudoalteromonas sp. DL2-H2.2 TaxID=2908889 RepID=UPI001F20A639|nr:hypothetical protein [Pseudoalteromonas sp. DL2-H2.2]MCF2909987.1 hypothetical protein [Pseudoalteromonas sp. DL2-H2.2]